MVKMRSGRYIRVRGCPYCGKAMDPTVFGGHPKCPTQDHVVPKSKGGAWKITVCSRCNGNKGDLLIGEWLEKLREKDDPRVAWVEVFIRNHADQIADAERRIKPFVTA